MKEKIMTAYWADALSKRAETGCHRCSTQTDEVQEADALGKRSETGCHRCSTQTDEVQEVAAAYDTCAGCCNYRHCRTHPCSAGCTDDCCPDCIRRPG